MFYRDKILEYNGKRVILGSTIDSIYGRKLYATSSMISRAVSKNKIQENIDYVYLDKKTYEMNYGLKCAHKGVYLLLESGAKYVTKEDNGELLNDYFTAEIQEPIIDINIDMPLEKSIQPSLFDLIDEPKTVKKTKKDKKEITTERFYNGGPISDTEITNEKPEIKTELKSETKTEETNVIRMSEASIIAECFNSMTNMMNNFMQMHKEIIQQQNEMHGQFRNEIRELCLSLRNDLIVRTAPKSYSESDKTETETDLDMIEDNSIQSFLLCEPDSDFISIPENANYQDWKKGINKAAEMVVELNGGFRSRNEVFCRCYKDLNKQYGIVWEQEKKDFFNEYGRSPVNTLELTYFVEGKRSANKNLMICKINTLYNETKRSVYEKVI